MVSILRLLGIWIITVQILAYFKIPVTNTTYILYGIFCFFLILHTTWKNKGGFLHFKWQAVLIKRIIIILAILLGSTFIGVFYFYPNFNLPQYISVDAAAHYIMVRHMVAFGLPTAFSDILVFQNFNHYPPGTSIAIALLYKLIFWISDFDYQFFVANILLYIALTLSWLTFANKMNFFKETSFAAVATTVLLGVGYNLHILQIGFTSQALGTIFLLAAVPIALKKTVTKKETFSLSIFTAVLFLTYPFWLLIILGIVFVHFFFLFKHVEHNLLKRIKNLFLPYLIAMIVTLPYITLLISNNILQRANDDGGAYKVFLINLFFFTPLIIYGIFKFWKKNLYELRVFLISLLGVFLGSSILYATHIFSAYAFYKLLYFYGSLAVLIFSYVVGVIFRKIELLKDKEIILGIKAFFVFFISWPLFIIFQQPQNEVLFKKNFFGTQSPFMEIYYLNASKYNTQEHPKNLTKNENKLSEYVATHFNKFVNSEQGIVVVSEPDKRLWFYAKTWIWPRAYLDNTEITSFWHAEPSQFFTDFDGSYFIYFDSEFSQNILQMNNVSLSSYTEIQTFGKSGIYQKLAPTDE